jgi:hypothetical protein
MESVRGDRLHALAGGISVNDSAPRESELRFLRSVYWILLRQAFAA